MPPDSYSGIPYIYTALCYYGRPLTKSNPYIQCHHKDEYRQKLIAIEEGRLLLL